MTIQSLISRLRNRLQTFRKDKDGHVVLTFALATIPIIGFVGAAVDYSRANSDKAAMQAAVDATALMLSKTASTLTQAQINSKATSYFNALFNRTDVNNIVITPVYTTSGGSQIVVTGTGTVPTTFTKVMGVSNVNINVTSTVKWGNSRLRVALVLDNTGSMAQNNKMTALKNALLDPTQGLLTQLKNAASQNGDVYVSIVPFVKDINVDSVNYNASWIDWTDWNNANGSCSNSSYNSNRYICNQHGGTWTRGNHNTWNGCVTDRGQPGTTTGPSPGPSTLNTDTNVIAPSTNKDTKWAAEQYSACPAATVMALNYNWSSMTTLVNSMSPNGSTNQAIGLAMGWMSLVGGGPFPTPPVMDPLYNYQQVIILLTDGLNTQDRWYGDGSNVSTQVDARQKMTCDNIHAGKVTLYTVQVNTGGDPKSTLLQNCAGSWSADLKSDKYPDPDKFFLLTSSSEIITTFQQIGTSLSNLRVAK
jgi:Flp pilus assembly protein TadG